jgi:TonB family protein
LDEPLKLLESKLCLVHPPGEPMPKGRVSVEYYVDHKGKVRMPRIMKSDGQYLSFSALETLKVTRFAPPNKNGKPTFVRVRQPFNFD